MNELGIHEKNELMRGFRVCLKTIKQSKQGYHNTMKAKSFLLSGGKTTVVFEFEEQIFNPMLLFVCISGMFYIDTAGNNRDYASIFYPASKFIVVITLIR